MLLLFSYGKYYALLVMYLLVFMLLIQYGEYGDSIGNTVDENFSIFSLSQARELLSMRAYG